MSPISATSLVDTVNSAPRERSISRGRGGRGRGRRGRGKQAAEEDHIGVVPPLDDTSKTFKGKCAAQKGKGKKVLQRGAIPIHENIREGSAEGNEVSLLELSSSQGFINVDTHLEDSHSSEVRVCDIHPDDDSLFVPLHTTGMVPNLHTTGVVPNDLCVEEQTRMGDCETSHPSPSSSLQEGTLHQELADFLMPAGVQACKTARKRTKTRKVLENENLWRELTAARKAVVSTIDPVVKRDGSVSEHPQTQAALHAEELNKELDKQDLSTSNEFLTSDGGENLPEVSVDESRAKESTKATAKRKKGQGCKERSRFQWPSPQEQHDVSRCSHQASDIDTLAGKHGSYSESTAGASTHSEDGWSDFDSIEVVENWQSYCPYAPSSQNLVHSYEDGGPKDASLPLFTSSRISSCMKKISPDYYDLVLNAGGPIWALDWCPHRTHRNDSRREFLAVGAHPQDSPTHRLGEHVQGKGLIQLWAFDLPFLAQAQASWQYNHFNRQGIGKRKARDAGRGRNRPKKLASEHDESSELFVGDLDEDAFLEEKNLDIRAGMDVEGEKVKISVPTLISSLVTEEFDPPQMVLGLAHDAGLVWDAKWQPINAVCSIASGRLGYLAAVFGNGSMQVFDIPLPSLLWNLKSSSINLAPLVVKIKPVFKCSGLSSGEQKSLPLTIEWSSSPPHDLLLVGCHDGTVALWVFNPTSFNDHDTRPLTCFVADTAPIRALAFAPDGTDAESRNVVVTGGHSGRLLFWDLRDPFNPLWDLSLSKGGCILSIDWLLYPRGIVLSFDDGNIKTLGLDVALSDSILTGAPPSKLLSQGMHTVFAAECAVWSIHVSRASGIAVYGGEDGSIVHCQLAEKYFGSDKARAREPHYLCCKLIENTSSGVLSLDSITADAPLQVKNQRANSKHARLTNALSGSTSGNMYEEKGQPPLKSDRKSTKKRKLSLLEGKETDDEDFWPDEMDPLASVFCDPNISGKFKSKSRAFSTTAGKNSSEDCNVTTTHVTPSLRSGRDASSLADGGGLAAPPKAVAVHRVRWNQNRGCESLVCFGGAAGIIRCQLIMRTGL